MLLPSWSKFCSPVHHLGMQLLAHLWKEMMQTNLIFQGSLDFYLPKCYGVYSQNSKNLKYPCIAFINRLGKKGKHFLNPTWAKNKALQGQITVHLVQQPVSKNSTRKHCVGRAISHVCGLPPLSQHPVKRLGIFASGPADPLDRKSVV